MEKNQKSKIYLFALLTALLIIGIFGWSKLKPSNIDQAKKPAGEVSTSAPSLNPSIKWKTLTNLNHSFKYPEEATAEAREEESIVYFMGQKQIDSGRTQTELFDGYSFRVGEIANESDLSLEQLAEGERENAVNNCHSGDGKVSQIKSVIVDEQNGLQYSVKGCYLDYTETIVTYDGKYYRLSQAYVGDIEDQDKYEEITNQMLSSFNFTK